MASTAGLGGSDRVSVMDCLVAAAVSAPGGSIRVVMSGDDGGEFVVGGSGEVLPVPPSVPPPEVAGVALPEPAEWGFRGWLNRVAGIRINPAAEELAWRRERAAAEARELAAAVMDDLAG
jgi:hypothetical protein